MFLLYIADRVSEKTPSFLIFVIALADVIPFRQFLAKPTQMEFETNTCNQPNTSRLAFYMFIHSYSFIKTEMTERICTSTRNTEENKNIKNS